MYMGSSAKGADARHQTGKELARPLGGALDTAAVLRVFLNSLRFFAIALATSTLLTAADTDPTPLGRWVSIDFPRDSPVLLVSSTMGSSTARVRGTSMEIDLHASAVLRNVGTKPLAGLTMRVETPDMQAGKGSVKVPSLTALPGETFPVRIDIQILRPLASARSATLSLVQVALDCALFADLTSYGPDLLHSRHSLIVYEMQARREREYLAELLRNHAWAQLRDELNFGLPETSIPHLGFEFVRGPLRTAIHQQDLAVNPVAFNGAPIQPIGGGAQVVGNEVRAPHVEVRRTSNRPVRSAELGWIVRDEQGRDYIAGSTPVSLSAEPIQSVKITESAAVRFLNNTGQPMAIGALRAFVNDVEFGDGKLWIPSRADIDEATSDPILRHELATSPEQQRLAKIYRLRGTAGLIDELKKLN
jgi:hypothetical protein